MGIRGTRRPLYVESNSKSKMTSPSILDVVDSFGGLSFAPSEGSCKGTNHFVESLNTFR